VALPADIERTTGTLVRAGERIYYEVTAADPAAPVLVLSHGLGGNHASWWQQVASLSGEFRLVTWDQRGFGNSTRHHGFGPEVAVDDLLALVEEVGGTPARPVHLVGQSMGGWVALGAAMRDSRRVATLTLTDTIAGVWTDEIRDITAAAAAGAVARYSPGALGRHPALGDRFAERHPEQAVLYQLLSSMGDKPPEAEVFVMLAKMRVDLGALAGLDLPVHVVVGGEDELCPPDAVRKVAEAIPGAAFTLLPGTGHSPYFEDAAAWNAAVAGFIGDCVRLAESAGDFGT
jgi:pimeloyl-ACP methyl ester carboxylesterase